MTEVVKHAGITLVLGGQEYVVPPLSLGAWEQMQERMSTFTGDLSDKAQVATAIDAALAALKRNYPSMTREELSDMLDIGNMVDVVGAVMDVSGARRKKLQEAAAPGEA
jgi:hypothetical protein